MTREEAIFCEKSYIGETNCTDCKYYGMDTCISRESHKMAIKALEQEPCEGAVSRQAVDELSKELVHTTRDKADFLCNFWEGLQKLPPVTPRLKTGHWIDIMVGDMPAQACDKCNTFYPLAYTGGGHKYCPNCGIRMEVKA